jgi:hypothetical protein
VGITKVAQDLVVQMCLSMEATKIMLLNMEAVTFHNMDQVLTRIVMVVALVKAKHKKHTHLTVKVMLLLQVWVVLPSLNIQPSLPLQNPSGVLKHNKSLQLMTMVLPLQAMLLQLLCQVNLLITNNLLYTHQQH